MGLAVAAAASVQLSLLSCMVETVGSELCAGLLFSSTTTFALWSILRDCAACLIEGTGRPAGQAASLCSISLAWALYGYTSLRSTSRAGAKN
jgi:hypothetical protein